MPIPVFIEPFNNSYPVVERKTITAILVNPSIDSVVCLDWERWNWKTFVIGGVEPGEKVIPAAMREIGEETGYYDLKPASVLGEYESRFFAAHKQENRIAYSTVVLVELQSLSRAERLIQKQHKMSWVWSPAVKQFINLEPQKYAWRLAQQHLVSGLKRKRA